MAWTFDGTKIHARRKALGLTRGKLAEQMTARKPELPATALDVERWDSGVAAPSVNQLGPLSHALDTCGSVYDFYRACAGKPEPMPPDGWIPDGSTIPNAQDLAIFAYVLKCNLEDMLE